jgi:hypothetical protein
MFNGKGRKPKGITKEKCLQAMKVTRSVKAASRYLGVDYRTAKKYFKLYKDESGKSLFEIHKNRDGWGIKKVRYDKETGVKLLPSSLDIIEGRANPASYESYRIKNKLINEGFLHEVCNKCGFKERRALDNKIPLVLRFEDNNKLNYNLKNLELLCYNCYFLFFGDTLNGNDILQLETNYDKNNKSELVDFELDEYHLNRLKELGLDEVIDKSNESDDSIIDGFDIISKI